MPPGASEAQLRRAETRTLGARHAAEHAAERAALRRWRARPAAERARMTARARRAAARATVAAGAPDAVGRWSSRRIDLPTWAINAVLLPTGKVAYWGRGALDDRWARDNSAPFYLLDPGTGASKRIDPPQEWIDFDGDGADDDLAAAPIFCSGQSLLPSGELFVAGGNAFYPSYGDGHAEYGGWSGTYSFDPWTERWTVQPRMRKGRWYPTQAELPDGRIAIASGYDERGEGADDSDLEVFRPAAVRGAPGTITRYPAAERATQGFYPHMQTLPDGRVAYVGQYRGDARVLDPARLDRGADPWSARPRTLAAARVGGSAALLPGTARMLFLGGYGWDWDVAPGGRSFLPATAAVESMDFAAPSPAWQSGPGAPVPALNVARSYGTLVQLPDGGFAYVGGAAGFDAADQGAGNNGTAGRQELKRVELWHPGEGRWRLGPAQAKWRGYHSTAVLLPDGRVLSAGDDYWGDDDTPHRGAETPQDRGELYEPAYLFDGDRLAPRPAITAGPDAVGWRAPFTLGVDEVPGRRVVRATLVAPTAVTHAVDMNRAFAELPVVRRPDGRGVDVVGPAGPAVAPPGWYLLFVWDDAGTPSVARWVRVSGDAGAPPGGGGPGGPGDGEPDGGGPDGAGGSGAPAPGPAALDRRGPRVGVVALRPDRGARALGLRVGADEPARVTLRVRTRLAGARTVRVRLTRGRLARRVRVPLAPAARARVRDGRTLQGTVRVVARDGAGNVSRRTVAVRVRPRGR
ncbi:glyoxal oxidase [Patulibacter sp. SYSU D01012]|uniref:galactose oxidase-like domain-containing protein n=1 Tax=Patulibacter sp. SYSU D01012 TaxID=2817381 RepID=UPI001B303ACE